MNKALLIVANIAAISGFIFCIIAQLGAGLSTDLMLRGLFLMLAGIWCRGLMKDGQP